MVSEEDENNENNRFGLELETLTADSYEGTVREFFNEVSGGSSPIVVGIGEQSWVTKLVGNSQGNVILAAEVVSGKLGHHLNLPIPRISLVQIPDDLVPREKVQNITELSDPWNKRHFASLVPAARNDLEVDPDIHQLLDTRNCQALPRVVAFDLLVGNEDRKTAHFVLETMNEGEKFWAVDHGHALGGSRGLNSLDPGDRRPVNKLTGKLSLAEHFESFNERLREEAKSIRSTLTDEEIKSVVGSVPYEEWNIRSERQPDVVSYLAERRDRLEGIAEEYISETS